MVLGHKPRKKATTGQFAVSFYLILIIFKDEFLSTLRFFLGKNDKITGQLDCEILTKTSMKSCDLPNICGVLVTTVALDNFLFL